MKPKDLLANLEKGDRRLEMLEGFYKENETTFNNLNKLANFNYCSSASNVKYKLTIERLEKLGFINAADVIKKLKEKSRKMSIAYEHFRFVRPDKIAEFQKKIYEKTFHDAGGHKILRFTPIAECEKIPPDSVLASLEHAIEKKCFDSFDVAHIELVKDPILFGRIKGCADAFFIDCWDNDVTIEEILGKNEG